jgi:surfactin synthase thioesterase subunit
LFCLPFAGAGIAVYAGWQRLLSPGIEVVGIHLPGREERLREPAFRDLDRLVDVLADVLSPCLDLPYAIYGHSLGAWIAFYLTRRLRESGLPTPAQLFVGAARAPHTASRRPPIYDYPLREFLEHVAQNYGEIPEPIRADREMMDIVVDLLRADMALFENARYRPGDPLDIPISAFAGDRDNAVTVEEVAAWREQTRVRFSLDVLPGDHFFLRTSPQAILDRVGREMLSIENAALV